MGRTGSSDQRLGGHAVACYGFGTTSDGTPYWKCLNSWGGNWGIAPRGEFMIHRPAGTPSSSSGLIDSCVVAPVDYSDIFPAGAVPPSPPAGMYCVDRPVTSLRLGGRPAYCAQLISVCRGHPLSGLIMGQCPITCRMPGCSSAVPLWGPASPSPPPGFPLPPPPPSPPPSPPPVAITDRLTGPTCNVYQTRGYCNYGTVARSCQRTCAGIPTDRYSNCPRYARLPGYCGNPNIRFSPSGITVAQACPDSCRGRTMVHATKSVHQDSLVPDLGVDLVGEEPEITIPTDASK